MGWCVGCVGCHADSGVGAVWVSWLGWVGQAAMLVLGADPEPRGAVHYGPRAWALCYSSDGAADDVIGGRFGFKKSVWRQH